MLTLIWGSDPYRMRLEAQTKTTQATSTVTINGQDDDAHELLHPHLSYQALIPTEISAVIVLNAQELSLDKELATIASAPHCHVILLFSCNPEPTKPQTKRIATLQAMANDSIQIQSLSGAQQVAWLQAEAQRLGATIDSPTTQTLIARIGPDSGSLILTLRQLVAGNSTRVITKQDLDTLIPPSATFDQWELANAVGKLDKRAIIKALHRQLAYGMGEHQLIGSLASGIRNLLMTAEHARMNMPPALIARTTGIHPFVLSKLIPTARTVQFDKLRAFHQGLARLDQASKQGRVDVRDGLYSLVLSL